MVRQIALRLGQNLERTLDLDIGLEIVSRVADADLEALGIKIHAIDTDARRRIFCEDEFERLGLQKIRAVEAGILRKIRDLLDKITELLGKCRARAG